MRKIVRQERLKDDKKARLIEAAIEEFNEHGLQNASYNRIIERSGLSKGAVYYYFENKDALFCTVLEDIGERFLEAIKGLELPETRGRRTGTPPGSIGGGRSPSSWRTPPLGAS